MKPRTFERIYPSLGEDYSKPGILLILRVTLSVALLGAFYFAKLAEDINSILLIAAALICGYDIVLSLVKNIREKVLLSENLTVTIAVILSFAIGRGTEGVIALLLLQLSYMVRAYALYRTREMICETIEPERRILKGSDTVKIGDSTKPEYPLGSILVIYEGIAVPVDCVIKEGSGLVDMSFVTGSDKKVRLAKGDYLPAGSVCAEGQFVAAATQLPENALYRKMASVLKAGYGEMTENEKAWIKGTAFFVPASLIVSIVLLLALPLIFHVGFPETIRRIVTVIAIASPCGVMLSIPMTYFAGMAAGRNAGIIYTHAKAVETAATVKAVVFDKIGTLTDRKYLIKEINTDRMDSATYLKVAAYASAKSKNFLAKAIVKAFGENIDTTLIGEFTEYPEKGISVSIEGIKILLGTSEFLTENGVELLDGTNEATKLHMSVNGKYAGFIAFNETTKQDVSADYFKALAKVDINRIVMISGDSREKDRQLASELGLDEYYAECRTEEKILRLTEIKGRIEKKSALAFVGDCDCNEKLFEAADLGIMAGGFGCGEELSRTDVVIMQNEIEPIPSVLRLARRTKHFVTRGAIFVCCIKAIILALAALGYAPLWFGLLIDFSAALAVLLGCTGVYSRDTSE
jgi:Cd2+/Zn2+-exporting ATPase